MDKEINEMWRRAHEHDHQRKTEIMEKLIPNFRDDPFYKFCMSLPDGTDFITSLDLYNRAEKKK